MGFLQPLALLGLGAAALPALIHLFGRKEPPVVSFPAVRYLSETERVHSRRLKLRNLLLLLLRTLLIMALALAAARPVARIDAGSAHSPTAIGIVFDNSLSSGAVTGGVQVLDRLKERALRVIERLTSDDDIWLVMADGIPERLTPGTARLRVDSATVSPVYLSVTDAVAALDAQLGRKDLPREIVVIGDLQRTAFTGRIKLGARLLIWESPGLPPNRAIDSARAEPEVWSGTGRLVAGVSGSDSSPAAATLFIGGREAAKAVTKSGNFVVLRAGEVNPGWYGARILLDADEFRADDEIRLAIRVSPVRSVSLGAGAGRFLEDAVTVLEAAGRARKGNQVRIGTAPGTGGVSIVLPPSDPALVGGVNRQLAAAGAGWRYGGLVEGEWLLELPEAGTARVFKRYRLNGTGEVLDSAGSLPWMVKSGNVIVLASRMEEDWTDLPVSAGFVPFVDDLINRISAGHSAVVRATPGSSVTLPQGTRRLLAAGIEMPVSDRVIAAPLETGVYFLAGAPGDTIGALEVNHDPKESRFETADLDAVRESFDGSVSLLDDRGIDRELFGGAHRADLAGMLLVAAATLALLELLISTLGGRAESHQ